MKTAILEVEMITENEHGEEIELAVSGSFLKGDRGSYWQPPEDSRIVDIRAFSLSGEEIQLSAAQEERAEELLLEEAKEETLYE